MMTLASFEDVLLLVGSLAMNKCLFLGELPAWLTETEFGNKVSLVYFLDGIDSDLIPC